MKLVERIAVIENRLLNTIDKLNALVASVQENQEFITNHINGSYRSPGLHIRVSALEDFKRQICVIVGILFTAIAGVLAKIFISK